MDELFLCNLCKRRVLVNRTEFSCKHVFCPLCMNRLLIINEFSGLDNSTEVTIFCNCMKGEYKISISDLGDVLSRGIALHRESNCINHFEVLAKHYCLDCCEWRCTECINKHTEAYPDHKTTNYLIEDTYLCPKHLNKSTSHYCKQCKVEFCEDCMNDHTDHKQYSFNEYFEKRNYSKASFRYSNYTMLEEQIEKIAKKYEEFYENEVKEKETLINSLIDQLKKSVKNYRDEMIENKLRILTMFDSIKQVYRVYYNNYNNPVQSVQYYKLSKLFKRDFHDILFFPDQNEELKTIQDMIDKYSSRGHLKYKFIFSHFKYDTVAILRGHKEAVLSLACIKQGTILASGSQDHYIRLWDLNDKYNCLEVLQGHSDAIYTLYELNNTLLSGSRDDRIIQWNLDSMKINTFAFGHSIHVYSLIQISNGKLVSGSRDETIKLWEIKDNKITCIKALKGHENTVLSLIELTNDKVASASADSKIKIWDMVKYKCVHTITEHTDSVNCIIKLLDNNFASCSSDKTVKIFNHIDYKPIQTIKAHKESVYCLIQLNDGRLASGSCDFTIIIWDIQENTCFQVLKGHTNTVFSLLQLKDGRLVSSSGDNTIRIWN